METRDWDDIDRSEIDGAVHYTCDGNVELLTTIPASFLREGDTASAETTGGDLFIWRAVSAEGVLAWSPDCPWSEGAAASRINDASTVMVLGQ